MSLTYQPFAHVSRLDEVRHDLARNLHEDERFISILTGTILGAGALATRGLARWALLALGAALVRRGIRGRCEIYAHLGIDSRHGSEKPGVRGEHGTKVEQSIEIDCPPEVLYRFWRNLAQLPQVLSHVDEVRVIDEFRSHWVVRPAFGPPLEWDAEIINDHLGELISWQSLRGADLANAGTVRFEAIAPGRTLVRVVFEYERPSGAFGAAAALFSPAAQTALAQDLEKFRSFAERELVHDTAV